VSEPRKSIGFFATVFLLFRYARRRSAARSARQSELISRQANKDKASGKSALGVLATIAGIFFGGLVHYAFFSVICTAMYTGLIAEVERDGRVAVSERTHADIAAHAGKMGSDRGSSKDLEEFERSIVWKIASDARKTSGGRYAERKEQIISQYRQRDSEGFTAVPNKQEYLEKSSLWNTATYGALTLGIFVWILMLVCQGEGLELDIQRRRHPVWEWLLSHPIRPAAMLVAEGFTPFACNPIYYTAPLFWFLLLSNLTASSGVLLFAAVIGLAIAVGASLLNKTIESAALLRMSIRNRGAFLGMISWLGFVLTFVPLLGMGSSGLAGTVARWLHPVLSWIPQSAGSLLVGILPGQEPSLSLALLSGALLALSIAAAGVATAAVAGRRGLLASESIIETGPSRPFTESFFGRRDPVFRKELLWFARDRGAIVQVVLIPATMVAVQAFNMRGLVTEAMTQWQMFCGLGILCGTYFLMVLGPRSLASEGTALWIPLTWPRGLEDLLRAKARLYETIANVVAIPLFAFAVIRFPGNLSGIILVAICWLFFARSMAMRSVTLVTVVSESGDAQPPPAGVRYASRLGALVFAMGVMTRNWQFAVVGVVFSLLVAAAAWQHLRARLPHLFDPWSEKLPPAPTLLHAMVGVAIMIECIGIVASIAIVIGGMESRNLAVSFSYGIVAFVTWMAMASFLAGRGVENRDIWNWFGNRATLPAKSPNPIEGAALAAGTGIALAILALGYLTILRYLPFTRDFYEASNHADLTTSSKLTLFVLTVGFAPLAEEYLFRGLLFRALDREWGGWKAILGSSAYFAIYHPVISWLPVFAVGCANAYLFRRTGQLKWAVITHAVYNAIVVAFQIGS
jgi:membrane protease YdiL (CAAX protease family)